MQASLKILEAEFNLHKTQLKNYLLKLTANKEDAEDLLHDTYLRAAEKLQSFENRSSLKTWIFTIATNLCRDYLRTKKKWPVDAIDMAKEESLQHPDVFMATFMHINQNAEQGAFEVMEHINFCFTCIGKTLPVEQQVALMLKEVVEYKVAEIARVMETTVGVVKHLLFNARKTMQDIFEQKCALINKEGTCHQCSELNGIFNPRQDTQEQLIKLGFGNDEHKKDNEQLFEMRMQIIRSIDPYESKGAALQFCHLEHINKVVAMADSAG